MGLHHPVGFRWGHRRCLAHAHEVLRVRYVYTSWLSSVHPPPPTLATASVLQTVVRLRATAQLDCVETPEDSAEAGLVNPRREYSLNTNDQTGRV